MTDRLFNSGSTPMTYDSAGHVVGAGEFCDADLGDAVTARLFEWGGLIPAQPEPDAEPEPEPEPSPEPTPDPAPEPAARAAKGRGKTTSTQEG